MDDHVRLLYPAPRPLTTGALTAAEEQRLSALARQAHAGDRAARDELLRAVQPDLARMVAAVARLTWTADGPRRDGRPWDAEDLAQEAFLIVADLIAAWSGEGSFPPYLFAYFPWRLRNAWRRLRPRRAAPVAPVDLALIADESHLALEAAALLASLAAALPEPDRLVLLAHVRDDVPLRAIAGALGVSEHQVRRRWRAIKQRLRDELLPLPEPAPGPYLRLVSNDED